MTKYEIKYYQEEFLEAQEAVGKEVTKDWKGFGQTPASELKKRYSQKDFDPETKFYAFDGEKLVGFLTSTITQEDEMKTARLEFPLTLPGHDDAADLLFEKAVVTLQKKGVKKLLTRVGDIYLGTQEQAKKWDYKFKEKMYILLQADAKDLITKENAIKVLDFEPDRDLEQMVKIFVEKLGQNEDYSRGNFDRIINDKENFPIHLIARENNQIVGRALAYRNPNHPNNFNLGSMYLEDEKYFQPLIAKTIEMLKALKAEKISLFLFGPTLQLEEQYRSAGFSVEGTIDMYEKRI
ncbi:MAG: hypothetical protein FK734_14815 [Asgard group archaeon]|nr:hypothetical protein [Asgard group archaeon]